MSSGKPMMVAPMYWARVWDLHRSCECQGWHASGRTKGSGRPVEVVLGWWSVPVDVRVHPVASCRRESLVADGGVVVKVLFSSVRVAVAAEGAVVVPDNGHFLAVVGRGGCHGGGRGPSGVRVGQGHLSVTPCDGDVGISRVTVPRNVVHLPRLVRERFD